jgi:hypothetical protein
LKRTARPLRNEVIAVELQAAYDYAYRLRELPFTSSTRELHRRRFTLPTLPTNQQRREALAAVAAWQTELERLRKEG